MGRRRGQPYGVDLRERVLAAVGEPIRAVAARFAVSPLDDGLAQKVWDRSRIAPSVSRNGGIGEALRPPQTPSVRSRGRLMHL